jgi:hypothetical protein
VHYGINPDDRLQYCWCSYLQHISWCSKSAAFIEIRSYLLGLDATSGRMAAYVALGVTSVASFGISAASFGLTAYRAYQEGQSHAARYKYDYGEKAQPEMSFFTNYKRDCQKDRSMSYTTAFQLQDHENDRYADKARGKLAGWWSLVVEEHQKGLLPKDFFVWDSGLWLQRAHNCRKLVEPIDQANYKRLGCEGESGPYTAGNYRPAQYVYIEELEKKHPEILRKADNSAPAPDPEP